MARLACEFVDLSPTSMFVSFGSHTCADRRVFSWTSGTSRRHLGHSAPLAVQMIASRSSWPRSVTDPSDRLMNVIEGRPAAHHSPEPKLDLRLMAIAAAQPAPKKRCAVDRLPGRCHPAGVCQLVEPTVANVQSALTSSGYLLDCHTTHASTVPFCRSPSHSRPAISRARWTMTNVCSPRPPPGAERAFRAAQARSPISFAPT